MVPGLLSAIYDCVVFCAGSELRRCGLYEHHICADGGASTACSRQTGRLPVLDSGDAAVDVRRWNCGRRRTVCTAVGDPVLPGARLLSGDRHVCSVTGGRVTGVANYCIPIKDDTVAEN